MFDKTEYLPKYVTDKITVSYLLKCFKCFEKYTTIYVNTLLDQL